MKNNNKSPTRAWGVGQLIIFKTTYKKIPPPTQNVGEGVAVRHMGGVGAVPVRPCPAGPPGGSVCIRPFLSRHPRPRCPSSSAASTHDPPRKQWLAGLEAGAGSSLGIGGGSVVVVSLPVPPRCRCRRRALVAVVLVAPCVWWCLVGCPVLLLPVDPRIVIVIVTGVPRRSVLSPHRSPSPSQSSPRSFLSRRLLCRWGGLSQGSGMGGIRATGGASGDVAGCGGMGGVT